MARNNLHPCVVMERVDDQSRWPNYMHYYADGPEGDKVFYCPTCAHWSHWSRKRSEGRDAICFGTSRRMVDAPASASKWEYEEALAQVGVAERRLQICYDRLFTAEAVLKKEEANGAGKVS